MVMNTVGTWEFELSVLDISVTFGFFFYISIGEKVFCKKDFYF